MPKNIVICCDGTNNKFSNNENTNIVHLYSCLKNDPSQVTYYNPGVGTLAQEYYQGKFIRFFKELTDTFFAHSLDENVMDCYRYLMDKYQIGDKIYLFGFSRGAYSVRMLSGLINMFGLLHNGNQNHSRYILKIYKYENQKFKFASRFKKIFSRPIKIHFMGIWDTVISVGFPFQTDLAFPFSIKLNNIVIIRHAVSIDETRKHYNFTKVDPLHKNLKEVYFAGVHSDVGGGYPEESLSKISLEWIMNEAKNEGLKLVKDNVDKYVYGVKGTFQIPDFKGILHNPYEKNTQKLLELIPRRIGKFKIMDDKNTLKISKSKWVWKLGQRRKIDSGSLIHESVFQKIGYNQSNHNYKPNNLDLNTPKIYRTEPAQKIQFY